MTSGTTTPAAADPPAPTGADDLRGFHFARLMRRPLTWAAIAAAALAGAAAGTALADPAFGAAAAAALALIGFAAVFAIADSRAEKAFFAAYAAQRGLELSGRGTLPPATPLLRRGDARYAERAMRGPLADGVEGVLALYTYEVRRADGEGGRRVERHRYTVGLVEVPECAAHVRELHCRRRVGPRVLTRLEDALRRSLKRVAFESAALEERYEIFTGRGQDEVWLRQLFAPSFIVWLAESAPEKFAFELVGGALCCCVNGHRKSAAQLDELRAATAAVAARLREESRE